MDKAHELFDAALLFFQQREWKRAIRVGREVIKRSPRLQEAYVIVGQSYAELGNRKIAERLFRQALQIKEEPNLLVIHGFFLHSLGRNDEAEDTIHKALKIDPDHDEAHYNLGCIYRAKGDFAQAEKHLKRSIEIDPKYALAYAELGQLLTGQTNRTKEAVGLLKKAIKFKPHDRWSIACLANAFWRLRKLKAADEQYRRLLELWPDDAMSYWCYGGFLASEGDDDATAEQYLRKAVEIDPENAESNFYLGKHLLYWDREQEAKKFLRKAARLGHLRARELLLSTADC